MLALPNSLALGTDTPSSPPPPEYPHLYSSPLEGEDKRRGALEGEEKRWGVRKGRPCFLAKIPEALQNYLLLGHRKKW